VITEIWFIVILQQSSNLNMNLYLIGDTIYLRLSLSCSNSVENVLNIEVCFQAFSGEFARGSTHRTRVPSIGTK
jgi:hypothetical protein